MLFNSSLELLLLFLHLLSDFPVEFSNLIIELIQVPLDEEFEVRMLGIVTVSIFSPVHTAIVVPAVWQELVEEFFLQGVNHLIRHVLALLQ